MQSTEINSKMMPIIYKKEDTDIKLPELNLYMKLIPQKDKDFFIKYIQYLRLLAKRGLKEKKLHRKSFNYLYRAIGERQWSSANILGYLQKEFIGRNLSLSLLLEPLDGFEWVSKNLYPLELSEASPIFLQIISPITRMIAVLNNQTPPFYQPFSALIFSYISLYVEEYQGLKDILQKNDIQVNDKRIRQQLVKGENEYKELLSVTRGIRFRLKIGFFIGLNIRLIKKIPQKMNFLIYVNSFLYGLWYIISTKNKTNTMKIK